jgi:hypothetical protein
MRTPERLAVLAALPCIVFTLHAQDPGEIHGTVLDPQGEALPFANVTATQGERVVGNAAGMDGAFVLKPLPSGTWTVRISSVGHLPKELAGVQVTPGRITRLGELKLAFNDTLKGVEVIHWTRPLIEVDDPSRMSLLASELRTNPTLKDTKKLISSNFAGVAPAANGDGLYFRGARSENMASYIDGVRVSGAVPRIPGSAISSVTVYTGGLPAKYGDVTGGVVVIETKTYFEMLEERRALLGRD